MIRGIKNLKESHFDILVIGAGINGCAISRDAALRGAKVALIEKNDFASGASGKTTKLIHGGLRYLEQFNFKLVYESLRERSILLRQAPHLIKPLEFVIPVYKGDRRLLFEMKIGVCFYDLIAAGHSIHAHRGLKKQELLSLEQGINPHNLKGGVIYYDAQMDDIRLCLDNAISAYDAGATIANKLEAAGFIKDKGKIIGIEALDKLTGEQFIIRANLVINATGAWSNQIVRLDDPDSPDITRPTKGIHLVYKKLSLKRAILLAARRDKRIIFILPWRDYSLIGTTDTDYSGSLDNVYADTNDVAYLLEEAGRIFGSGSLDKEGIVTTFAGLRPLVNTQGKPASSVSREHLIRESCSGLISVVGGKYTTYRHLAEQVVDFVLAKSKGGDFKKCQTRINSPALVSFKEEKGDLRNLVERAIKEEMAVSLVDLLARRMQFLLAPSRGFEHLKECAGLMADHFGWTDIKKEQEIDLYKEEVRRNMNF